MSRRRRVRRRRVEAGRSRTRNTSAASPLPHPRFGWYAGLAAMAALEVIEWPLAILMMLGHEIAHRSHTEALRDFAEGVEAGV